MTDTAVSVRRLVRVAVAIVLIAVLVAVAGPREIAARLSEADPSWLAAGLGLAVLSNLLSAWRWRQLMIWLGTKVPASMAAADYFRGMTLNALLPGAVIGGDVYRAVRAHAHGLGKADAATSVLLDRLSGLWVLLGLGLALAPQVLTQQQVAWWSATWPMWISWPLAAGWLVLPLLIHLGLWHGLGRQKRWQQTTVVTMIRRFTPGQFARQYGLQVLVSGGVQVLSASALACGGQALGLDLSWLTWMCLSAPIFVAAALPIGFGGWGTREAAAVAVLGLVGVAVPLALSVGLIYGLFGLIQALWGALLFAVSARHP